MSERIALMLGTLVLWGVWAFLPKLAAKHLGSATAAFAWQSLGTALGALVVWLAMRGASAPASDAPSPSAASANVSLGVLLALGAGLCGAGGLLFYVRAVARDNVAIVASTTALYPLVAALLGRVVLGETMSPRQILGMGLAAVALVLIAR